MEGAAPGLPALLLFGLAMLANIHLRCSTAQFKQFLNVCVVAKPQGKRGLLLYSSAVWH